MTDLFSCPFCESGRLDDTFGQVRCIDCKARGPEPACLESYLDMPITTNRDAWQVREGRRHL